MRSIPSLVLVSRPNNGVLASRRNDPENLNVLGRQTRSLKMFLHRESRLLALTHPMALPSQHVEVPTSPDNALLMPKKHAMGPRHTIDNSWFLVHRPVSLASVFAAACVATALAGMAESPFSGACSGKSTDVRNEHENSGCVRLINNRGETFCCAKQARDRASHLPRGSSVNLCPSSCRRLSQNRCSSRWLSKLTLSQISSSLPCAFRLSWPSFPSQSTPNVRHARPVAFLSWQQVLQCIASVVCRLWSTFAS